MHTGGRLICGGDLNIDPQMIADELSPGSLQLVTSKTVPRRRGDCAFVSGLLAFQTDSLYGRSYQGQQSASDDHDAVVVHAVLSDPAIAAGVSEPCESMTARAAEPDLCQTLTPSSTLPLQSAPILPLTMPKKAPPPILSAQPPKASTPQKAPPQLPLEARPEKASAAVPAETTPVVSQLTPESKLASAI